MSQKPKPQEKNQKICQNFIKRCLSGFEEENSYQLLMDTRYKSMKKVSFLIFVSIFLLINLFIENPNDV